MPRDILFDHGNARFSSRMSAIPVKDGKVLLQCPVGTQDYAFIGGPTAFGETSAATPRRDIREEPHVDAAIRRLIDGEVVNIRIPDRQLYHQLAVNTHAYLEDYNNRHQRDGFYGSYSVTKSDAQQCLILYRNGN